MLIDVAEVKRVAHLSRISIKEEDIPILLSRLNNTLNILEKITEVNIEGIEPMVSVVPIKMVQRSDKVSDSSNVESILSNAPHVENNFFIVPKAVE
ncbi:Asp-tRNA(Asn)/Glu-tRNA(Gln) amidotransferase subunit GatC [Candidatus Liberibacter africanus]|uniref:Aspartyl/glutamyl-tRNA(Asn/Gln) amidotransferase subunit C n=1 Tax=Candidatus Liberibacter africanus PTSAPSY TaxID=1277257 RepID=A0A0G3I376_LIBAF|nr:Asp-tRNA(Asn)/Glu-tRNA(Gln) amidotransferase subunit GatC [Candidatus Liberibacter africanus]AKK19680.1 putative glutamyl-tRNA(Gln) amidotransferase subunit C protein [Candidatus Liberibacter africanus PTSAPSY]QTP63566.1 Asp-tRNA(Asn)/Glu-tRNA(Gln) amidotransferase subunit GatC [Candidatus Liberibacter africanus]